MDTMQVFITCLYLYCHWRSNYEEDEGCDPIKLFNTATFLCLSQTRTDISNVIYICCGSFIFYVKWVERWLFVLLILVKLFKLPFYNETCMLMWDVILTITLIRAPDNFQVQRVITSYFWKWWVFAYFLCTVVLSTSEKITYMYTFKIMFDTSVIQ